MLAKVGTRKTARGTGGGRGARLRILNAAAELFYVRGIHATGVAAIMEAAHVSSRTFYVHFPSKGALVEAYLRRFEAETPLPAEAELDRADLAPAERLLAIFERLEQNPPSLYRGCPFHNAAVEEAGALPDIADLVVRHKRAFQDRLISTAAAAGARDPESLGRQLAVLFEGANALAASRNDLAVIVDAKAAARTLLMLGLETTPDA